MMTRELAAICCMLCACASLANASCRSTSCTKPKTSSRCSETNKCDPANEDTKIFPPGGNLCRGKGCRCCVPKTEAVCVNRGGVCQPACGAGYSVLDNGSGCDGGQTCCVKDADKACADVAGECKEQCELKTERQVFNVRCECDKVCCVHKSREGCAKVGGKCFKGGCPTLLKSAGGRRGKCKGKDLKCCVP